MGDSELYAALVAFLSIGISIMLLGLLELRAQWKQREEANRLLIMALFRMSNRQIRTLEEQTRHVDAVLDELRAGRIGGRLDPALLAEARREIVTARTIATAEEETAEEEAAAEDRRVPGGRRTENRRPG